VADPVPTIAYADFGKDAKDLIDKGFPKPEVKILVETTTPNAIALKTTAISSAYIEDGVSLTVEPEFKWAESNITIKGKFVTDGTREASVALADVGAAGTKLEIAEKRDVSNGEKRSVSLTGSYANEFCNVKATAAIPLYTSAAKTVNVDAVAQWPQRVFWGVNGLYTHASVGTEAVSPSWNARVQTVADDYTVALLLENKKSSELTLSWFQKLSNSVKFATTFALSLDATVDPSCTAVGEYKVDAASTVRARLRVSKPKENTNLRLGLALTQVLSAHATATIGADVNASNILGLKGGEEHSLGFELKLK
jgi:hypothetical protein